MQLQDNKDSEAVLDAWVLLWVEEKILLLVDEEIVEHLHGYDFGESRKTLC